MRSSASVSTTFAAFPLALLLFGLTGCSLLQLMEPETPAQPVASAQVNATEAAPLAAAPAVPLPVALPVKDAAAVTRQLDLLVNDTDPADPEWSRLRAGLAELPADLSADLRQAVTRVQAFNAPRLRERWQQHSASLDNAATLYAEHPPVNTEALRGARVERRLGPALYLVRLPGGDTAFFNVPLGARRLKNGARLDNIAVMERPRPRPDRAAGDLVDELAAAPRTFVALTKQDVQRLKAERAPVLDRLKRLEAERTQFQQGIKADLASLDALTRDVNAVISPRLLGLQRVGLPVPAIRQTKHLGHRYSPVQQYRYSLPITGHGQIDTVLRGYLDERKKDVQDLLRFVGKGTGRARTNSDLVTYREFTAGPNLLSVRFETTRDTGGAHPNQGFASFVFDVPSQTMLGLSDLFTDLPTALGVLAELAARRMELALDGHVFVEGLMPKAENFQVFVIDGSNQGQDLLFSFPPYQVASYADGPQQLRVPLCHPRLLPLLSPKLLAALGARPGQ